MRYSCLSNDPDGNETAAKQLVTLTLPFPTIQ
jgi:hypothetical protein